MTDLPQPLTPADCNLRGLPFMPMMVSQVMQSETFGLSTGDEFKAAFTLWCASWLEVPAASLPNDDRMLEFLSRAKTWKKVKSMALRGWVLCSDGRLYHAVIAARAIEAWEKRTDYRDKEDNKNDRQKRWREQCTKLAAQLREIGVTPPRGASLESLRSLLETHGVDDKTSTHVDGVDGCVDDVEIGKRGRETVKREKRETTSTSRAEAAAGSRLPADWKPSPEDAEYCKTERPDLRPSSVAQNFYDYWIAKPGKDGRKTDWPATWRIWVRKESAAAAPRAAGQFQQKTLSEQNAINNAEAKRLLGIDTTDDLRTIDAH